MKCAVLFYNAGAYSRGIWGWLSANGRFVWRPKYYTGKHQYQMKWASQLISNVSSIGLGENIRQPATCSNMVSYLTTWDSWSGITNSSVSGPGYFFIFFLLVILLNSIMYIFQQFKLLYIYVSSLMHDASALPNRNKLLSISDLPEEKWPIYFWVNFCRRVSNNFPDQIVG